MHCHACCAPEPANQLIFEENGNASSSGAVLVATKPFDQEHTGLPADEPSFMGTKVQPSSTSTEQDGEGMFMAKVHLQKGEYPGFHLDLSDSPFLRVAKIENYGSFAEYNESTDQDSHIVVGDFIVAVNEVSGDGTNMMAALGEGGDFELAVSRAKEIEVQDLQKKKGESLGLDLTYQARSMSLVIKEIFPTSIIARYNQSVEPDQQLRVNDHIVSVCGKILPSRQLVQILTSNDKMWLRINRPVVTVVPDAGSGSR